MPYKNHEDQLKAQQRHYQRNKDRYRQTSANWKSKSWGGNRKTYDELTPLAPTVYHEIAAAGYLTTVQVAEKYNISDVVVRNAATAGRIKYKRWGSLRAILPEDAEYWFNNIYKRRKPVPTKGEQKARTQRRREEIDKSLEARFADLTDQPKQAVLKPLPQGDISTKDFVLAIATINRFAKQVARELTDRDNRIKELEDKLKKIQSVLGE